MEVKIIIGDAWYKNEVGNTFEVEKETTSFRQKNGGSRVQHYIVAEENADKIGGLTRTRLIECRHAEIIKNA